MSERRPALRQLAQDLWVAERTQRFYGLEVGTRMTVIRLADGSLLLHSPVALASELRRELDAIGRVCFAVAPNRVHHLYAGKVAEAYPPVTREENAILRKFKSDIGPINGDPVYYSGQ